MNPAPYNTETPFTAADIERFNRFTNFPKSQEKENIRFAEETKQERAAALVILKRAGQDGVPDGIERALERVRKARYEAFMASVRSREIAPPWSVVGPANYHKHARPERARRTMDRAMENLAKAKATLARNLDRLFPSGIIRSDEPDAVQRLQAEIDEATRRLEKMKSANKIIRTAGLSPDDKVARLKAECGLEEMSAQTLLKPDFAGRIGFPDFKFTNNSANIHRMQARLMGLKREAAKPSVVIHFPGGRVEDDSTLHRVRIFHDSKPAREEIDRIKLRGFHWSPRDRCWQRLRNDSARAAAADLTGIAWPAPGGPPSHVPSPLVAPVTRTAAGGRSMRLTP